MNYKMQELLPIVAELTEKYTSKESTSVTYEKASQLMEAVLFCIHENEMSDSWCRTGSLNTNEKQQKTAKEGRLQEKQLQEKQQLSAKEAYEQGYQKVLEKVNLVRKLYNQMAPDFCAYGNWNYEDTFRKGIPGFLKLYNARFYPQYPVITMDYPILEPILELEGVDAIYAYLRGICCEQIFLSALPEEAVCGILKQYHNEYENLFCNLCAPVLREIFKSMLAEKKLNMEVYTQEEKQRLAARIRNSSKAELQEGLRECLEILTDSQYDGNPQVYQYLCNALADLAVELKTAESYGNL